MSEVLQHGLDEALVDGDPVVRMIGRAGASRWFHELQAWVNAELKRGEKPAHLLQAMMITFVRAHSGFATQFVKPEGFVELAEVFKKIVDDEYVVHAELALAFLISKRGRR